VLAKAEEGQNRQNHNDQAYEIDKTVHGFLRVSATIVRSIISRQRQSSLGGCSQVAVATLTSPTGNFCLRSSTEPPFTSDW
jgi:hypothetical protein